MEIEVGKWYRRGDYKFVKVMGINGDEVIGYSITYLRDLKSITRGVHTLDLNILKEYFVETNEKTIDMLLTNDL